MPQRQPATTAPPDGLLRLFALEAVDEGAFTAAPRSIGEGRIFGGQVAGQSLRAACHTVPPDRAPHSLHAYFIRPGRPGEPLRFDVGRTRDGRSFGTRHVTASQGGKPIFEMIASFHAPEPGHDWQPPMPMDGLPGPEELGPSGIPPLFGAMEIFDVRPLSPAEPGRFPVTHPMWIRSRHPLGDDPVTHACAVAFLTDLAVVDSSMAPDAPASYAAAATLDHSVWFHRPVRADEWMLYSVEPTTNFGARGLARGTLHAADGTLVASIAQETLLRPAADPS
jgi:acyl-CoA thioesterase-2